ncbi:MAG: NAD-dependent epimerase/dehydratase family protein, partial [Gammaproteobacteria bacterium]|nr:NAD-dependent epimerase/dehydratase family protein [Gammaproteobacteria bacterium]
MRRRDSQIRFRQDPAAPAGRKGAAAGRRLSFGETAIDSLNVLITGATGLIGGALRKRLESQGHRVFALDRSDAGAAFRYSAERREIRLDPAIELDAVVNLAGANISASRWSEDYKRLIMDSRVKLTRALAAVLAASAHKPR